MKRYIKFAAYGVAGLLLLVILVVAIFAATFNPNDYKQELIDIVKEKKQRTLVIEGDLSLSFWPKLGANLGRVSLSEHNNDKVFASITSAKLAVSLLPLVAKQLVVDKIYLDGANANIVRYKDGTTNFDDLLSKDDQDSHQVKFDIDGVIVTNSNVNFKDEVTASNYQINKLNLKTGRIALAEPFDVKSDFMLTASEQKLHALVNIKGNIMADPKAKHYLAKGLDAKITGDLPDFTGADIKILGDIDAKLEPLEFLVDGLQVVAAGNYQGGKVALEVAAPHLVFLKDEVKGKEATIAISQQKNGQDLTAKLLVNDLSGTTAAFASGGMKAEMTSKNGEDTFAGKFNLADVKGTKTTLKSSGVIGDFTGTQGGREIAGKFTSPFVANLEKMIFELTKLAGDVEIKDKTLPNGAIKGTFALKLLADVKAQKVNADFNLNIDNSKLNGQVAVASFTEPKIGFNLNADQLDLNKLLGKSKTDAKPTTHTKPADLSALKKLHVNGKLNIGTILYDRYRIQNLNTNIMADGSRLELSPLNVKLDESTLKGSLGISNFTRPVYRFDLDIDQLNANKYITAGAKNEKKSTGAAPDLSLLNTLYLEGKLKIGVLNYDQYKITSANVAIKSDGQKFSLNPLNMKFDDSIVKGALAITQFAKPHYSIDLDIDQIDADRYVAQSGSTTSTAKSDQPLDLSVLKELNADGSLRIGRLKFGHVQSSGIRVDLKADGDKLTLEPLAAKIDDSIFNANLSVTRFSNPIYAFKLNIDKLDADRYITKNASATKTSTDAPIDLSALKKLNASGDASIGWLKLANVKTSTVKVGIKAEGGVATVAPFAADLYQGHMNGNLVVDARAVPVISFKTDMKGIDIGPLMTDAVNNDILNGKGTLNVDVKTLGSTVGALKRALAGHANVMVVDGSIKGIDIPGALRGFQEKLSFAKKDANALANDKTKKTDFSELTATFDIKNGVARNEDLAMKAPVLRLAKGDSKGDFDIAGKKINYLARPTLVASLKGQGGSELDSLNGIAIPVRLKGTFSKLDWGIDFSGFAQSLAKNKLLDGVGGSKGDIVKGLIGGGDKKELLKGLLGGKDKVAVPVANPEVPPVTDSNVSAPAAPIAPVTPAEKPQSPQDIAKAKAEKKLKKLLGL